MNLCVLCIVEELAGWINRRGGSSADSLGGKQWASVAVYLTLMLVSTRLYWEICLTSKSFTQTFYLMDYSYSVLHPQGQHHKNKHQCHSCAKEWSMSQIIAGHHWSIRYQVYVLSTLRFMMLNHHSAPKCSIKFGGVSITTPITVLVSMHSVKPQHGLLHPGHTVHLDL